MSTNQEAFVPHRNTHSGKPQTGRTSLYDLVAYLQSCQFVDLTHAFDASIPHWKDFPAEQREVIFDYDDQGFIAHRYSFVGQWGTHVDPPAHFVPGLRTLDKIPVAEMILPLVVLDVHEQVARNPDYAVTMDDVRAWEAHHGKIPPKSFVALRTDWSKRWPDRAAMYNCDADGVAHTPGWSLAVLRYLYEECRICASGHETIDTDPGVATSGNDYGLEKYILGRNCYQIELLANLDLVPAHGALVVVTWPKPLAGSGFPARVFAVVP
jgi:kynurenine formamidase